MLSLHLLRFRCEHTPPNTLIIPPQCLDWAWAQDWVSPTTDGGIGLPKGPFTKAVFKHVFNLGGQEVDAASGGTAPMDRASGTLQWLAYTPPIPLPSPKLSVDFAVATSLPSKQHGLPSPSLPHCTPLALICHGVPQSHVACAA